MKTFEEYDKNKKKRKDDLINKIIHYKGSLADYKEFWDIKLNESDEPPLTKVGQHFIDNLFKNPINPLAITKKFIYLPAKLQDTEKDRFLFLVKHKNEWIKYWVPKSRIHNIFQGPSFLPNDYKIYQINVYEYEEAMKGKDKNKKIFYEEYSKYMTGLINVNRSKFYELFLQKISPDFVVKKIESKKLTTNHGILDINNGNLGMGSKFEIIIPNNLDKIERIKYGYNETNNDVVKGNMIILKGLLFMKMGKKMDNKDIDKLFDFFETYVAQNQEIPGLLRISGAQLKVIRPVLEFNGRKNQMDNFERK